MGTRIRLSRSVVREGGSIRVAIRAPRRRAGERLTWSLRGHGIGADDLDGRALGGALRLDRRGRGRLRLDIRADARREGREQARLQLWAERRRRRPLAGGDVRIKDRGRLKIMAMGDSISVGFGAEAQAGYRGPLRDQLAERAYQADFVGAFGSSSLRHWGRSGWLIAGGRDPITGETYAALRQGSERRSPFRNGIDGDVRRAISSRHFSRARGDRNVLLLLIGSNDILNQVVARRYGAETSGDRGNDARGEQQNRLAVSSRRRLRGLLGRIDRRAERERLDLDVVVGTIPDQRANPYGIATSATTRSQLRAFNGWIRRSLDGSDAYDRLDLSVVNQFKTIGGRLADGIHPSARGYDAMATAWRKAIETELLA